VPAPGRPALVSISPVQTNDRPARPHVVGESSPGDDGTDLDDPRFQEIPRPAGLTGGRLRVIGYPFFDEPPVMITELPLSMGSYEGAVAAPRSPGRGNGRVGAIYTADGDRVVASHRGKIGNGWDANPERLPDADAAPERTVPGRSFYAGHWGPVFGHVLLETLPRFWPDVDYSAYDHLVFYPKRVETTTVVRQPHIDQLIGAAGPARADYVMLAYGGARFEQIDIASAPILMKDAADVRFLDVFDRIADRLLADHEPGGPLPARVYLSRSRLNARRKRQATNEEHVESMLGKQGFAIVHPQELSIPDQVAIMRGAEVIAGCDGSGLHMSAFARPGTKLLAIDSRTVPNQFLVDQARQLDALHVLAVDQALGERSARWRVQGQRVRMALDMLLSES